MFALMNLTRCTLRWRLTLLTALCGITAAAIGGVRERTSRLEHGLSPLEAIANSGASP
jgi:hypothetical protein